MFRHTKMVVAAISLSVLALVALVSFQAGQGLKAQDTPEKIVPSKVGFIDLDAVLEGDKALEKELDKLAERIKVAKADLKKNNEEAINRLTADVAQKAVASKEWLEILKMRAAKGEEYIEAIDDAEVTATLDRNDVIVDAMARVTAAIEKVAKSLELDTVIRIQTPDKDATDVQIATFQYKAQRTLYFSPKTRDVTELVLKEVNKDFKEDPEGE